MAVIARDFFFLMANVSFLFNIQQYTFIVENSGNVIAQKRLLQTRLLGVSVSGRALPRLSFGGSSRGTGGRARSFNACFANSEAHGGTAPPRGP